MGFHGRFALVALAACTAHHARPAPVRAPARVADPDAVPFGADDRAADLRALRDALRDMYAHLESKQQQFGVNLDALFTRYEPQIRAATTWTQYELVMVTFVSELHDGHITWRRTRAGTEAKRKIVRLGLDTVFVGDELIVSAVWPGSSAEHAGLTVGDKIIEIDGHAITAWTTAHASLRSWSQADAARYQFAEGWPASRIPADREPQPRHVTRERADGTRATLEILPEGTPRPGGKPPPVELVWRGDVAILRVHSLKGHVEETTKLAAAAAAAILAKPQGLVVDLRDNDGGFEDGARGVVAQLTAGTVVGANAFVRLSARSRAAHTAWKDLAEDPAKPGWSAPMPISATGVAPRAYPARITALIDAGCASSCETLSLLLRAAGATLAGERTAGAGGAPVTIVLPFSHARVSIPVRASFDLTGAPIEGRGVSPDEPVARTRADVTVGRDPALERAVDDVCPRGAGRC